MITPDILFDDADFLPEYLDTYVANYIKFGGNPEGIDYIDDVSLNDYLPCMRDITLDNYSRCQAKFIRQMDHNVFSDRLSENIIKAMTNIQLTAWMKSQREDFITDALKTSLNMIYEIRDQSRCGVSEDGKGVGEVDLSIWKEGLPLAMLEAIKLSYIDKLRLSRHIDKLIINYDQIGCRQTYLLIYYTGKTLERFWNRFQLFLRREYQFASEKIEIYEGETIYTDSRSLVVKYTRN